MRIAYVIENLSLKGGMERIMVDKMNYLADMMHHDVHLIEVYQNDDSDQYAVSTKVSRTCLGIRKKRCIMLKPLTFMHIAYAMRRCIDALQPDIMISGSLLGVIIFGMQRFRCHTIYESHGPRHMMLLPWLINRMEHNVDCVVTITDGDAQEYKKARRVEVIPNFLGKHIGIQKRAANETFNIVALGRLSPEKGFDLLIDAFAMVNARHTDTQLDIYGSGICQEDLQKQIKNLGLSSKITIHAPEQNVAQIYSQADVIAVTSQFEGFSLVILEALSAGVPVVACDVPYGPRYIIGDSGAGILTERNAASFADAMVRVIENKDMLTSMSANSQSVVARFQKDVIMKQWNNLFKEMQ